MSQFPRTTPVIVTLTLAAGASVTSARHQTWLAGAAGGEGKGVSRRRLGTRREQDHTRTYSVAEQPPLPPCQAMAGTRGGEGSGQGPFMGPGRAGGSRGPAVQAEQRSGESSRLNRSVLEVPDLDGDRSP